MLCYAREPMLHSAVILLLIVVAAAPAQLVINQGPEYQIPGIYPAEVPDPEQEPVGPQRTIYDSDPVQIDLACDPEALLEAGLSCTPSSPCRLELELLLAESVGERLLLAGSVRSAAGTLESVLLVSSDGGGEWTEPVDRVPAGDLETAQFVDAQVGWVGGQSGVDGAVSQPFLLFTKDGGASFDKRLIRSGEEPEEGFIVQLQFDSAEHGHLILEKPNAPIDPFALYETYNGGRSWSIRQIVAERPAIPGARRVRRDASASDLRLSPGDGVIELERRDGAGWARLSGFVTELGVCPAPPEQSRVERELP